MKTKTEARLPTREEPFTHFELHLDKNEEKCLAEFEVINPAEMMGVLSNLEQSFGDIQDFVASIGENDLESCTTIVNLILRISREALQILQQESAHILIRSFVPNEDFDLPRWHQDGYYFLPFAGTPMKAVLTLKGDGTVFYSPSESELEQFKANKTNRHDLAALLVDPAKISSTPPAKGSFFIVGSEAGAIHTVPKIRSQRFFVSVLPGTKREIERYDYKLRLVQRMRDEGRSGQEIMEAMQEQLQADRQEWNKGP